jgi:hypothetical protein
MNVRVVRRSERAVASCVFPSVSTKMVMLAPALSLKGTSRLARILTRELMLSSESEMRTCFSMSSSLMPW